MPRRRSVYAVYSDGGTIAGAHDVAVWAWCHVARNDYRVRKSGGHVYAVELGAEVIHSTHAEYHAALLALEALPPGWSGTLYSDSMATLASLRGGRIPNGAGEAYLRRAGAAMARLGQLAFTLVRGHPTALELEAGEAGGRPVSRHNAWCDRECSRQKGVYLLGRSHHG